MATPTIVTHFFNRYSRVSITLALLFFIVNSFWLSLHWMFVVTGLVIWQPRQHRIEEAGIELTVYAVNESSSGNQNRIENAVAPSPGNDEDQDIGLIWLTSLDLGAPSPGNDEDQDMGIVRVTSSGHGARHSVGDDTVRSANISQPD